MCSCSTKGRTSLVANRETEAEREGQRRRYQGQRRRYQGQRRRYQGLRWQEQKWQR